MGYGRRGEGQFWWSLGLLGLISLGLFLLLRGVVTFVQDGGSIPTPIPPTSIIQPTATEDAAAVGMNFVFTTPTPQPECQTFYVTVIRARIRECPSEDCETLDRPPQNTNVCVWRVAPNAPEWYEINLDPGEPIPRVGYMHNSVIYPRSPTKTPSRTPRPTAISTVTPVATPR
ncbi:MAG: hypothetical protein IT322_08315 [Anaerolineae bacterium]|nr:hypothetical protein [Anaerolineae bacterium]CAG0965509.1 hypothetical protein ANRL4_00929 [Anaerolineae bacterium]